MESSVIDFCRMTFVVKNVMSCVSLLEERVKCEKDQKDCVENK